MTTVSCCDLQYQVGTGARRRLALEGVSFAVAPGEIVAVVGSAGAGKSILLRILAGRLAPTAGTAHIGGRPTGTTGAQRDIGYAVSPPLIPPELTGLEWLAYLASHRAASPAGRLELVRWAVEFAGLEHVAQQRVGGYSRHGVHRLAVAAAAVGGRVALLLDDVLTGIDPVTAAGLRDALGHLAAQGRTLLVATNDLTTAEHLATRVLVLAGGRLVADVPTATLLTGRVVELALPGQAGSRLVRLAERFDGAAVRHGGVAIPLLGHLTVERILAVCRDEHLPVAGSRVRYRGLEDLVVGGAAAQPDYVD